MNTRRQQAARRIAGHWQLALIATAAFLYAGWFALRETRTELLGAAAMLLLGGIAVWQAFDRAVRKPVVRRWGDMLWAWGCLLGGIAILFVPELMMYPAGPQAALLLFFAGAVLWFGSRRALFWMVVPLALLILVIPFREQILLFISYPLRLSSTAISVAVLQWFGVPVGSFLTTIQLEGAADIAITDACSGIQQFEAMLLISYILVQLRPRHFLWKCAHYLFLLPAIIIANSIRIILIIVLYRLLGEAVLVGSWHIALGYVQLFLALALIFAAGWFLPERDPSGPGGAAADEPEKEAAKP